MNGSAAKCSLFLPLVCIFLLAHHCISCTVKVLPTCRIAHHAGISSFADRTCLVAIPCIQDNLQSQHTMELERMLVIAHQEMSHQLVNPQYPLCLPVSALRGGQLLRSRIPFCP